MSEAKNVKTCPKCNEDKELNAENFSQLGFSRKGTAYYRSICKACIHTEYRAKNAQLGTKRGPRSYFTRHPERKEEVLVRLREGNSVNAVANMTGIAVYAIRTAIKNREIVVDEATEEVEE